MSSSFEDRLDEGCLSLSDQILKYEHFVDVVLKGDLTRILAEHERICEKVAEYNNIKSTIANLQDNQITSFKSMTDIGSNCYVKCVISDASRIYLNVGLSCYVELTLDEAIKFIEKRIEIYNKSLESLTENSSKVKAHIKLVLNLIDQLQNEANDKFY